MIEINKIHLKNVTSFDDTTVEFGEGINVLLGENGTGKTSVVSMLGFILFGYQPRTYKDLVRYGSKKKSGEVTAYITGNDGQEYSIYRKFGSGPKIVVENVSLGRVLNKIDDVPNLEEFLHEQMGLDPHVKLDTLFKNAVGVEQGNFTNAFLESRRSRQEEFRELLNLEKYRQVWKDYKKVDKKFNKEINLVMNQMSHLEGRLESLEVKQKELSELKKELAQDKHEKEILVDKQNITQKELEVLKKLKDKVEKVSTDLIHKKDSKRQLESTLESITENVNEAKTALKVCEASKTSYEKYIELEKKEESLSDDKKRYEKVRTLLSEREKYKAQIDTRVATLEREIHEIGGMKQKFKEAEHATELWEALEVQLKESEKDKNTLEATLATNKKNKILSEGGNCPFLKEKCKNIGGGSLEEYFQEKIDKNKLHLKDQHSKILKIKQKQESLRNMKERYSILESKFSYDLPRKKEELKKQKVELDKLEKQITPLLEKKEELSQSMGELEKIVNDKKMLKQKYDTYISNLKTAEGLGKFEKQVIKIKKEILTFEEMITQLHSKVKIIEEKFDFEEYKQVEDNLRELNSSISKTEERLTMNAKLLTKLKTEIKALEEEREQCSDLEKKSVELANIQNFGDTMRSWFDEVEPKITEIMIASINQEANRIFHELMDDYSVDITWERDFAIFITTPTEMKPFDVLSGGEKMIAALAVRLGLLKYLSKNKITFAIFDEPTINLDEEKRRNLAASISRLQGFSQIFVISHDDTFEAIADHVIRFSRTSETPTKIDYR